ncbi:hypothetical protein UFOVP733_44 [uncultured Caudovirales phage]|uniref:Uncharacterized protein n=1 Tax=uncultured Caudovirales phage TaxID=2100421 RepID=A0A6J5NNF3_9CAUD|nr:hypothetical protein UFOVP733_44 [uncultured Caudovirales phage]CAB5224840.1 hypothetical protein UFOVP743_15 [uncultured Caudovirales phage]
MKWISEQFKEIQLKSLIKIVLLCVGAFGTYTSYTANKLNNFIVEVEEQNVVFRTTISSLRAENSTQQKEIQFLKKYCDEPSSKEFYS